MSRIRRSAGRAVPSLVGGALRVVWQAAPVEAAVCLVLQLLNAGLLGLQVVACRAAIAATIGTAEAGSGMGNAAPEVLTVVLVFMAQNLVNLARIERERLMAEMVGFRSADSVLRVASGLPLEMFEQPEFHDRLERARVAALSRPAAVTSSLMSLLSSGLGVIGICIGVATIEPLVIPVAMAVLAPVAVATRRNSRASYEFAQANTATDRLRAYLFCTLTNVAHAKEVRAFELGAQVRERHAALFEDRLGRVRRLVRGRLRRSLVAGVASGGLMVLAVSALATLMSSGSIDAAGAGAAFWGLFLLAGRLQAVGTGAGSLHESALHLKDLQSFVDLGLGDGDVPIAGSESHGSGVESARVLDLLRVENLGFTYPGADRPTLQNVDLEIRRGEVVALVGANGSGKSTLAKLIAHLYVAESGHIMWNGDDTADLDPAEVRRSVSVVFQDFVRWEMSANDNIAFGDLRSAADRESVVKAARTAEADGFLSRLPSGYETLLSRMFTGGTDLSLGQWQRVALARAFYRDAPLLVVDEPTASLDPEAEAAVYERLHDLGPDRSVLLISHRLASVRSADRIYVLDEGRVLGAGTHDQLMANCEHYARLFNLQAASYGTPPVGGEVSA